MHKSLHRLSDDVRRAKAAGVGLTSLQAVIMDAWTESKPDAPHFNPARPWEYPGLEWMTDSFSEVWESAWMSRVNYSDHGVRITFEVAPE